MILGLVSHFLGKDAARVLGLAGFFFLVIACYWLLKPLRSTLTVGQLGADSIAGLRVITAVVSALVVVAYSKAVGKMGRRRLAALVLGSFFWLFMLASLLLLVERPPKETYYAFYVAVDLFITVNVALFWGLVADVTSGQSAPVQYGWIGAGGVVGGLVGSLVCHKLVSASAPAVTTLLVAVVSLALVPMALWLLRPVPLTEAGANPEDSLGKSEPGSDDKGQGRPAGESISAPRWAAVATGSGGGAELWRYLGWLALLVAGYEFASAFSDFTFHKSVELLKEHSSLPSVGGVLYSLLQWATGPAEATEVVTALGLTLTHSSLGSFFGEFFLALNLAAVALQLLVTPLVLKRWGPAAGILVLPALFALGGTWFLLVPALATSAILFVSDNSLNYSLNQTSRQMLFKPVPGVARYKALAFTDILVQRSAKALAGFALLGFSASGLPLSWAMALLMPVVLVWLGAALVAGVKSRRMLRDDFLDR